MVDIVPNVQQSNDPNWLGWSKPIQQPGPDKSTEIALKTAGEGIKDVVEVGADVAKTQAKSGADDILAEQIQNTEIQQSLLKDQDPNQAPQDVMKAKSAAEALGSSKANGAISPTYYYGKLLQYQKDMRSMFPMYRNQIDQGIAEATGVRHTANEYYESMLKDLNSRLTHKDEYKTKLMTEAFSIRGHPMMNQWLRDWRSGKLSDDEFSDRLGDAQAQTYKNTEAIKQVDANKAIRSDWKEDAKQKASGVADNAVSQVMSEVAASMGFKNSQDIMDHITNPGKYSPQENQAVYNSFGTIEPKVKALIADRFKELPKDPRTGKPLMDKNGQPIQSWSQTLGEDADRIAEQALKPIQAMGSYIKDGQYGAAAYFANNHKAAQTAITDDLYKSQAGITMLLGKAIKDSGAPEFIQDFARDRLKAGLGDRLNSIIDPMLLKSYLDKPQIDNASPGAVKNSFQQDIKTLFPIVGKNATVFKTFIDDLGNLDKPTLTDKMKAEKIRYMFGPENVGVLSTWQKSGLDPTTGRISDQPGQMEIFTAMTSKPVTYQVRRLDAKYPGLWDMYKSTATTMLDDLIGKQVRDLNTFQEKDGWKGKVKYTSAGDVHRFDYISNPGQKQMLGAAVLPQQKMLEQLNAGIRCMVDIAKAEGSDPDAYVLRTLTGLGYQLPEDKEAVNFPEAMVGSMRATHAKEKADMDAAKQKLQEKMTEKRRPQ